LYNWVQVLRREGLDPEIIVVERFYSPEPLADAERYWIKTLREAGYRLVNLTDGGEGAMGRHHTEEAKRRISLLNSGVNHGMYGKTHTPEVREKIASARRGKRLSDATIQKLKAIRIGRATRGTGWKHTEESKNKMREIYERRRQGEV
jgi:group I intron endonuclease